MNEKINKEVKGWGHSSVQKSKDQQKQKKERIDDLMSLNREQEEKQMLGAQVYL